MSAPLPTWETESPSRVGPAAAREGTASGFRGEARKILIVLGKDLRIEWRNLDNLPAMFFFSLLVLVIFNFGFDFASADFLALGPGVLWVAFSFAGVLSFGHSFTLEREGECIQGLRLAPVDPGTIYLGKMLANFISMLIVEAVLLPLSAVLFTERIMTNIGALSIIVLVHTLGFAAIGTLFGAMTARTRRGDVLLPILLFSVSVPLMISAVKSTGSVLDGAGAFEGASGTWLVMALIFDVVFVTAAFLTFEYIIEE